MARPASNQPTEVELGILKVVWESGPSSLGHIHEAISTSRETAYSSTRKMVQVMKDKGLLSADNSVRPNLYTSVLTREETQLRMADELANKAFEGSSKKLVMSLVSSQRLSRDELQEIKQLIRKAERSNQ